MLLYSCENSTEEIGSLEQDKVLPIQVIHDVEILYSTDGKPSFQLNAPLFEEYGGENPYTEMRQGIHVKIFDSTLAVTSELTANYAIDLKYEEIMEAKDNVVVINDKGERLNTEHLVWDKKTGKITSDVFVEITTENEVIMGEGLVSNQSFTEYKILKTRGIINIDND